MSSNRPLRVRFVFSLAPLAVAGLLGACATDAHKPAPVAEAITPTEQFPLKAAETPGQIRLAPHPNGLSPAQRDAVEALADRWLREGGGPVTIRAPSSGADPRAADVTSGEAEALLHSLGVPEERIRRVGYDPSGDGVAPVIIAYSTYEAVIPRCGQKWENLSTNGKNRPMENFGCAVSANMAAQIADPADIAGPRDSDPTDAGRRTTVIDDYREGKPTAGAADSSASGTLSSIGSGGSH
jgi:pilus assembly protein CpaD